MGKKDSKLTQAANEVCESVVQTLTPIGDVSSRKMFGGHGIFENGAMFALVNSAGELFFKVDDTNRPRFDQVGSKQHGKMPYFQVPSNVFEDANLLQEWAQVSIKNCSCQQKEIEFKKIDVLINCPKIS